MKFPYTFSAKIAQFPYKHTFKTNWIFRYYLYAVVATLPFFMWVNRIANSPGNVARHQEYLRKQAAEHGHH